MNIVDQIISIRTPKPNYPVLDPIQKRFSPRVFSSEPIPNETINSILEAARLAPSARNAQQWYFYWTKKGSKSYELLLSCLSPSNHQWAGSAPVLILACTMPYENKENPPEWAYYDLGQTVMALTLQAQDYDIYARQIGMFDKTQAKKLLHLPENHEPCITIALGKMGTEEDYTKAEQVLIEKDTTPTGRKDDFAKELL